MKKSMSVVIMLLFLGTLTGMTNTIPVHAANTWVVTNTNDIGIGSLRHAIENSISGDTITFDQTLSGQTIITTGLSIEHDLTIDGTSLPEHVKISGNNLNSVIYAPKCSIQEGCIAATIMIKELDIINGIGGVRNLRPGIIYIYSVNFDNNHNSGYFGGAISNDGNMTISNSTFTNNTGERGGAIFNSGTMTINKSVIANNTSENWGGGIYNENIIIIYQSSIYSNAAEWSGDGVYARKGTTNANTVISESTIYENAGQGVFFEGSFTIGDTNDKLTIVNSTITGNTGGGVVNTYGSIIIKNSTIANNSQPIGWGGGSGVSSFGDNSLPGTIIITNSIIANNINGKDCSIENTQIIESTGNLIENNGDGINNCGNAAITSDPLLSPLSNNGGPTQTMALLAGSPAIDTGNDALCAAAPVNNTSQNGITRPQGSHCDIGTYEYPAPLPDLIITNVTISPTVPLPNQTFEISITIKNQGGTGSANTVFRDVYINRDPSTLLDSFTHCPPPGDFFRSDSYTSLPAGMTDTKTVTITGGLPSGNHQLWFYVDSRCLVDEGGGSNSVP